MRNPFKSLSRPQLYAVLAGGTAIAGYAEYKHHQATGSWSPFATGTASRDTSDAASSTSGEVTDPDTGQSYSDIAVDPATSMTYASEISQFGSVAAAEAEVTQYGKTTNGSTEQYDTGYTYQQASTNLTTANGQNIYVSNSAWAQAVQAGLEDVSGSTSYDGTDIGTALGAYLQGEPLTPEQAQLISVARAEYGPPPVGNLQVITKPTVTATPPPTTTTTTAKPTQGYPAPTGLKVKHLSGRTYQVTWNLIKGTAATGPTPTSYTVAVSTAAWKTAVEQTVSVPDVAGNTTSTATVTVPASYGTGTFYFRVWANGNTGFGPKSAQTSLKITGL